MLIKKLWFIGFAYKLLQTEKMKGSNLKHSPGYQRDIREGKEDKQNLPISNAGTRST